MDSLFAVLLGVISSLAVVIFVEWQRQPRLILTIPEPSNQDYIGRPTPAQLMRCLRIRVRNQELPFVLRWLRREPAINCLATVQFLSPDGSTYFPGHMPARWTGSPEATAMEGAILNGAVPIGHLVLWDSARLSIISKMDIPAGEQEDLDIVVRCDDDRDCYGFNNESYRFNWRNPQWRIPQGRYRIEVVVRSAGMKIRERFVLYNEPRRDDSRLARDPYPIAMGETGYPPII